MRVNWILGIDAPVLDSATVEGMKDVAPIWSGTSRMQPGVADNLVCHDLIRGELMLRKRYDMIYNLYVTHRLQNLGIDSQASYYQGQFDGAITAIEDIICLHLVASISDLVILVGFDLETQAAAPESEAKRNRLGMIRQLMTNDQDLQWILVQDASGLDPAFGDLPNVSCDALENVLHYFSQL